MLMQQALAGFRRNAPLRLDPAWTGITLIFSALVLAVPHQATISAWFTAQAALNVAPFFALSIALAAYAKASGAENLIARAFRTPGRHDRGGKPDGRAVAVLFVRRHPGDRRAAGERRATRAGDGVLACPSADGPVDVHHHGGRSRHPVRN